MAKRRSQIPLYELMGGAPRPSGDGGDPAPPAGSPLSPGRAVRVPVGYVFIAIAACLLLLVGAYIMGYQRGAANTKARYGEQLKPNLNDPGAQVNDPLRVTPSDDGPAAQLREPESSPGAPSRPRVAADVKETRGGPPTGTDGAWGPIESDPRVAGLYYRVLVETRPAGAIRLAEFLREKGLESYVIPRNNGRLRVIVLPGFSWLPERFDPDPRVQALYEQIATVGQQWMNERKGTTDFSDAYWVLYTP